MLLAYLLACHTARVQVQGHATVEIPVHNRRPSSIVQMIERGQLIESKALSADDRRGCVIASGSPEEVSDLQQLVSALDVAKRKLVAKMEIDSPLDKENYHIAADVYNNDKWKTTCGESAIEVGLQPRLNSDGSVTATLSFNSKESGALTLVSRMKVGSTYSFVMRGVHQKTLSEAKEGKVPKGTDPTITLQITD